MFKKQLLSALTIVAVMSFTVFASVAAKDDEPSRLPFLGIRFSENEAGVVVTGVAPNSPAEAATLQVDDVITAIDDVSVTIETITETVQSYQPEDTIMLSLLRGDETLTVEVVLGAVPAPPQPGFSPFLLQPSLGVHLDETDNGLVITEVAPQSPAESAGLQAEDTILTIDGEDVNTVAEAQEIIREQSPGESLAIEVQRDDETLTFDVTMDAPFFGRQHPGSPSVPPNFDFNNEGRPPFGFDQPARRLLLGVRFATLGTQAAETYNVDISEGAYIVEVIPETPAELIGLQVGDVVTAVDGDMVDIERTLSDRMFAYEVGDTVILDVWREGETLQIDVTLGPITESADLAQTT